MNDNSKISEVNGKNEPCRELATPIIFLYMDTPHHRGAGGVYRRGLVVAKNTACFGKYFGANELPRFAF
ncbi:hypothetical protein CON62_20665 [Bacillus toyonensis]|nr:hypothetical protein CON62_20665 [Bacillus toyonensis]